MVVVLAREGDSVPPCREDGAWVADERDGNLRVPHERGGLVRPRLACDDAVEADGAFRKKGVGRKFARHLEEPSVPVRVHPREVEHARKDVAASRPRHPQDYCNSPYALHC